MWLLGGVALTAAAGYLLAALVLFPAPLLESERQVTQVFGLLEDDAIRALGRHQLMGEVTQREPHAQVPAGMVIWQDPPPGVTVPRGATVQLVVSTGPPKIAVPHVRGYALDLAQRLLTAAGLRVELVDTVSLKSPSAPSGTVGSTTPAAGDSLPARRGVTLHLVQ
jgi:serine/threonine-protein kinase